MDISTFKSNLDFIKSLYSNKEWKDEDCKMEILRVLEFANENIEQAFGRSMHRLGKHKPTFEAVEKVVNQFPSTLTFKSFSSYPIHTAVRFEFPETVAPEYVPVLAKEGLKHNVGGRKARGLLLKMDSSMNALQMLCHDNESVETQKSSLTVLKELRKMGLFVKKDIIEQDLLYHNLRESAGRHDIFDYLVDWDPDVLLKSRYYNKILIQWKLTTRRPSAVRKLLEAGFKYHPNIGGLLFIKDEKGTAALDFFPVDDKGTTALDSVFPHKLEANDCMDMLYDILTPAKDYPILHHIFTKAPKHKDLFIKKFPWAASLKDHNGRSLQQAILAAGPEVMNENDLLFAMLTDDQIQEKDPVTTLFPFAAMAVGDHANLEKCYYLLRRYPSVLDNRSRANSRVHRPRKKQKVSK
ncbi:hypothetical protein CTEN210_00436 [Chaetoceros tenuissimus]|uniref:Uncharacterized protein n=1 Tax=Chaetoceros tenuissimus TaxID=426638 RepID=A0AAD3CD89_9STRA|nr:hypothetical protein CTEN210_00436 [Chaetoceros tenuissimus]